MDDVREIRHFHLFAGLGGGAKGFNRGEARVGNLRARFRCVGGIDVDAAAMRDFNTLAGVPGTVLDLFDRDQYHAFHGHRPPKDWREATRADIHEAAGNEAPHIVFLSPPCKGFSGLLAEGKSKTEKYQALNCLTLRGLWLMLEAFADDPPALIALENVPRIANRGRFLLDQIVQLLGSYGYAVAETTHDCGELGGLAQSRKRFLMVARHVEKVPPFLYEPHRRHLRAVGDVLGRMPLPGDHAGGPMHRIPRLQWKTWVRLAFVQAGADWRSLQQLAVVDGLLRDFVIVPAVGQEGSGVLGVRRWDEPSGCVVCRCGPTNGAFSVADPRFEESARWHDGQAYGVRRWDQSMGTIAGQQNPGQGAYTIADPRIAGIKHNNCFRVVRFGEPSVAITAGSGPSAGGIAIADPRPTGPMSAGARLFSKYAVTPWVGTTGTVISGDDSGAYAVADPRPNMRRNGDDHYVNGGHYGVVPWDQFSGAVSGSACHDNGPWSVADPRVELPPSDRKLIARIISEDRTWHRPFTTLELAALQGLIDPEEQIELDGLSDSARRERIGNAVPPPAATAIASMMGHTLLLA